MNQEVIAASQIINHTMYSALKETINSFDFDQIKAERKHQLNPIIAAIQERVSKNERVNINCICTHNSRRSQLSQIWLKIAAMHYKVRKFQVYSGGTEATAVFPKVIETVEKQGLRVQALSESSNPVYAIKYIDEVSPIICFSKKYANFFNPQHDYIALMTCNHADKNCPIVTGAAHRFPIPFVDPKVSDNTPEQTETYLNRSHEIGTEMFFIMSKIVK